MPIAGTITSQGVGANIDLAGILTQLMAIERIPLDRLEAKVTNYDARISALGSIKSSLSSVQSALAGLTDGTSILANAATSSDTSLLTATGTTAAVAGNYTITEIDKLAQSQKLVATGQADQTVAIGLGGATTLTIDLGTTVGAAFTPNADPQFVVNLDGTNNTLEGIRDAINDADGGVTATIVNDGGATPYRLVLSSTNSGADESMRIVVAGEADLVTLLNYDPAGAKNLTENVIAQDAQFKVDGIAITKSSNTVTDVISGVTLNLLAVDAAASVNISVSQDTASAKTAVEDFVKSYNDLREEIKKHIASGSSDDDDDVAGAFAGDYGTRQILDSVRDILTQAPTGIVGDYQNLSSIGVSFQTDGSLAVDTAELDAAILTDSDNVAELFSSATDGYATRLDTLMDEMLTSYSGIIDSRTEDYTQRISLLEDRKVTMEAQLLRIEERMRARFTALDVLIGSLSNTSNYLSQQIAQFG